MAKKNVKMLEITIHVIVGWWYLSFIILLFLIFLLDLFLIERIFVRKSTRFSRREAKKGVFANDVKVCAKFETCWEIKEAFSEFFWKQIIFQKLSTKLKVNFMNVHKRRPEGGFVFFLRKFQNSFVNFKFLENCAQSFQNYISLQSPPL